MSGFSFTTTAGASQSTVKPPLKGNAIHTVKFDGCEVKNFEGKKDPTKTFKTLVLKFSNDDGQFESTTFEPTVNGYMGKSDFDRSESEFKDKDGKINKIPQASNVESMMLLFKHAIDALNPKVGAQIDNKEVELGAADWDGIRELIAQILKPAKGVETRIKLVTNQKGEPKIPSFFAAVNREGQAYIKNNFIGNKVAFTPYELKKITNESTAKPTDMDNDSILASDPGPGSDDLDLNFDL